jgi:succinate dehydrogenase/fumarate reductase cytochrome b subunit
VNAASLPGPSRFLRVAPAIVCLGYPLLVWCISGVSSIFLIFALLAPICCGYAAFHLAGSNFRTANTVAHFGIGAPALYSFMGQWLDSQKVLPFHANAAWAVLWLMLTVLTFAAKPGVRSGTRAPSRLAFMHGVSAIPIVLFALVHLTNHLAGLWGGQMHIAFMHRARLVYRVPPVEIALCVCILFQFASGLVLVWRSINTQPAGDWMKRLQSISGAYMALFLMSHVSAVARTRYLHHVDTNWVWLTSSNLLTDEWSARLTPYYFLGIVALGLHGACAARLVLLGHGMEESSSNRVFGVVAGTGLVAAIAIMAGLIRGSFHA